MGRLAFSINEAAKAAGVNKYTIIEAVRDGAIDCRPTGTRMRVYADSLKKWSTTEGVRTPRQEEPPISGPVGLADDLTELKTKRLANLV